MFKPAVDMWSCRYSMVFNDNSMNVSEFMSVECITLDELFEEHKIDRCDLVKMDIEGAEYETLYNASDDTLGKIGRIVGEYHHLDKGNKGANIEALKKYLVEGGYQFDAMPNKRKDNIGLFFCKRD
jgi:hypothetical protein